MSELTDEMRLALTFPRSARLMGAIRTKIDPMDRRPARMRDFPAEALILTLRISGEILARPDDRAKQSAHFKIQN